jgi:hypothetical protein
MGRVAFLQVVEEAGVASSLAHTPVCSLLFSLPRVAADVCWSLQMPLVVSFYFFRSRRWSFCFTVFSFFAWLSFSLATAYLWFVVSKLFFLLMKYMARHVLKKSYLRSLLQFALDTTLTS